MDDLEGRYDDEGSAEQVPILLLHAYPYHRGMWAEQVRALQGHARVLTLDARGMTPGAAPVAPYLLEHLVDDALALLDQRGVTSALVCGLSMGGYVALRLTQRAPSRVRGLLLANTQAAADGNAAKLARAEALRLLWREGKEAFADAQLKRQLAPETLARRPELVATLRAMIVGATTENLAASMVALVTRPDLVSFLPEIRVPTMVLAGAQDQITQPGLAIALGSPIPDAAVHVLPGAGHLSSLESEGAFNARLLQLLERVSEAPEG